MWWTKNTKPMVDKHMKIKIDRQGLDTQKNTTLKTIANKKDTVKKNMEI